MAEKHFNIPIFIPRLACPFQCLYCDQARISGMFRIPSAKEITGKIRSYLETIPGGSEVQLAYFGGNFTGISMTEQEQYLSLVTPFIESGEIKGIRLSTRPDYIDDGILSMLRSHHVTSIELGAQSMNDDVLRQARRGHTVRDTEIAAQKILRQGFELGLQMMIGLPGDTRERSVETANGIIALGASDTRIYPTLVIKGTVLEKLYLQGKYSPLGLEEAVERCAEIMPLFEKAGVNILKVGLHPSDGLMSGEDLVAGPFHPSFRELVETKIWEKALAVLVHKKGSLIEIQVAPGQLNPAVGYQGSNRKMLGNSFKKVKFKVNGELKGRSYNEQVIP